MSGCSCVYVDTDDQAEAFSSKRPVARKQHKCCECSRIIEIGEPYLCETGIWDGIPHRYKTCADCKSIRDEFFCNGHHFENLWDALKEYLYDSDGTIASQCLINLTPCSRDKVFKILDKIYLEDE